MKKLIPLVILACAVAAVCAVLFNPSESKRITRPDGAFTAVVSYRNYQTYLPSAPGDSGGMPGFITIYDRSGQSYGRIPLSKISQANELQWTDTGAIIPGYCNWEFSSRSYRVLDEDHARQESDPSR
ncbi:hypothetical protein JIN77_09925 [Verrucomicrobiaceae bacterium R5-34]|uniref:Uncharacterized protein n=1 Tax=Oceaniferula flava TaxID=2800421 RepID=A0AAE2SCA3_9BACT|nr:hypothetical protein [Oceaniferula flavus]MBK1831043.1 hypothetical protein [Verrucomicrobiaceae bacterium R5-34]MBK1855560.1 hypothetical protein [Oceaniferula flavus]MBM1136866.1 hypothetical protein [Oceaniferula flavus]